jgi:hypothetical protein
LAGPRNSRWENGTFTLQQHRGLCVACGDFSEGRFGWHRGSYCQFPEPIPYRGRQTLFNVPEDVVAAQISAKMGEVSARSRCGRYQGKT